VKTKEALASQDWLNVSSESILEFLDMECLNITEAELVRALIRWGKYQMQHGRGGKNLRSKILPGLRKIRFGSFIQLEIVQLCQEELGVVLSDGEKSSILMSIISGNWSLMPKDVVPSTKLTPRHGPYTFCSVPYAEDPNKIQSNRGNRFGAKCFIFQVDKNADIVGVKLNLKAPYHELITFSLHEDKSNVLIATGSVNITSRLDRGEVFCPFNTMQTLVANQWYLVTFQFNGLGEYSYHCGYVLPIDKHTSFCDGLTLNVIRSLNSRSTLCVHILGIVFSKR